MMYTLLLLLLFPLLCNGEEENFDGSLGPGDQRLYYMSKGVYSMKYKVTADNGKVDVVIATKADFEANNKQLPDLTYVKDWSNLDTDNANFGPKDVNLEEEYVFVVENKNIFSNNGVVITLSLSPSMAGAFTIGLIVISILVVCCICCCVGVATYFCMRKGAMSNQQNVV